ncbi:ABC transporter ATP-binding protein [Methanospirillum sp. J.3.6.1-F.2.7.3]|uniref:Cobalamin import ATP-binding protein BtuD n=1 Tax=Methanospirillum purgamenti TaxID=2834276 RepID=A0A8E7EJC5_9EURY|nr:MULTISPECIES: ABC transporter ATP-binding protein [Methanospirillum]MDX8548787.1 ABC transporter ATP-binding protein [Methanospirillum hungatei]QVV88486.1 ABC transporter ATP-binding protein [Methanospirillum sp. J.3.6.1-F.2.7.3]
MGITYTAHNLQFSWDGKRDVFKDISFSLHSGDIFCIIGPNGTGKSTLMKCMIDILEYQNGVAMIDGTDIRKIDRKTLAKRIAYVPQGYQVAFPYSVLEYVLMGRAPYISAFSSPDENDLKIALHAIQEAGIMHIMDKSVNEVSGGEHQMALIARALAQEPELLLLDEPTSHLDFGNQMQVLSLVERLKEKGITIVMTSHFPDHAFMVSDLVGIMKNGSFINIGPAEEVITNMTLKETYMVDIHVEFVEIAGRKVCIPVKNIPGCTCPIHPASSFQQN